MCRINWFHEGTAARWSLHVLARIYECTAVQLLYRSVNCFDQYEAITEYSSVQQYQYIRACGLVAQ